MRLPAVLGGIGTPLHIEGVLGTGAPARVQGPVDRAVRVQRVAEKRRPADIAQFLTLCVGSGVRAVLNAQGAPSDRVDVLTGKAYVPHPGGIIAAPSLTGPDYRFVWDRDSALCARALVGHSQDGLARFVDWAHDHHQRAEGPAPFVAGALKVAAGQEWAQQWMRKDAWAGLGEARVSLDGSFDPFGWGRPQNDGPALRVLTLIDAYRTVPDKAVRDKILWCLRRDLDYVTRTWPDMCFDLWEETLAAKHYYTREVQAGALHAAVDFIEREGVLLDRAGDYAKAAASIDSERGQFWNGRYLEASLGALGPKALDANVILAAIHSGRIDSRVMATAHACEVRDRERYPVNADCSAKLAPAIGRYVGDVYEGGGPFYMLTAGFAELYYAISESVRQNGIDIDAENRDFIAAVYPRAKAGTSFAPGSAEADKIATALLNRGDAFIRRIAKHVTIDTDSHGDLRVRIPEQLDGTTGAPRSAPDLTWSSACMVTAAAARDRALKAQPRFPFNFTVADVMADANKARAFVEQYFDHEAPFFALARDPKTGLTYDGVDLDRTTREVIGARRITAPSKECSDVAVIAKILSKDPLALRLVAKGKDPHAEAVRILTQKIDSYERFDKDYPGYGGFMPWIKIGEDGSVTPADDHWLHAVPSLDNGEWVFTLIAVERTLRQSGETALADRYKAWIDKLRKNVRRVFFDEKENAVRTQAHIPDIRDPDPQYSTDGDAYIRGPHGVYEGAMILDFVSLYADPPLTDAQVQKLWAQTKITRVETPYGTTMQGFWYSSHETWRALFMPLRDHAGWRTLLRNMEIVRTQLTQSPGELASINSPYSGRQTDPGPPYAGDIGPSQSVALEKVTPYQFYAIYGVFPLLLEQYAKPDEREGIAWLLNSLRARNAETSIGGGESVNNDGSEAAPLKTADGSFLNWLALMGGVVGEIRAQMKDDGTYDKFLRLAGGEFAESFAEPLRTPVGFALPKSSVPWMRPRAPTTPLAIRTGQATTV